MSNILRSTLVAQALLLAMLFTTTAALGVITDDYEVGGFSLQTDGANVVSPMFGLDPAHVLGGNRVQLGIDHDSGLGFARASLVAGSLNDSMRFTTDPTVDATFVSSYDATPGGADMTEGGAHDRVLVNVSNVTGTLLLRLRVRGGGEDVLEQTVLSPGVYSFHFSDYVGVNFSNVTFVSFQIHSSGAGNSIDIVEVTSGIVPEPSAIVALGFGVPMLLRRRTK